MLLGYSHILVSGWGQRPSSCRHLYIWSTQQFLPLSVNKSASWHLKIKARKTTVHKIHDEAQGEDQMLGGLYFGLTCSNGAVAPGKKGGQVASYPHQPWQTSFTLLSSKNVQMENGQRASWNRCLISLKLAPKESRSQLGILMLYLSLSTDGYFY